MIRKLMVVFFVLCMTGWGLAEPLSPGERQAVENINTVFRRAIEQVRPAVVNIQVRASGNPWGIHREHGEGSGCIIDAAGYIITNNHVVEGMERVEIVLADHRRFQAVEVFLDPDTDLAIVKIDPQGEELPYAQFGDSDRAMVGDFVMAMGSPFGLEQTVTVGIISFKGRQTYILDQKWGIEDFIQTDADINQGNSGGPLVNLYGEIIGVNSNIFSPTGTSTGYGFSIPSNLAGRIAEQLIAHGVVKRGWLGVTMSGLSLLREKVQIVEQMSLRPKALGQLEERKAFLETIPEHIDGVLISEVFTGTPAERSGVQKDDLVLSINDHKVVVGNELRNYITSRQPYETVTCEIWREGKIIQVNIKLGDRDVAKREDAEKAKKPTDAQRPKHPTPLLGVRVQALTPSLAEDYGYEVNIEGLLIDYVEEKSLADESGLVAGDIITHVNGRPIQSVTQLKAIMAHADLIHTGILLTVHNHDGQRDQLIQQGAR